MNDQSVESGPSYAEVTLKAPPQTIARLMTALGEASEIIFDLRGEPDARGDATCTARVAVLPGPPAPDTTDKVAVVVQSTLSAATVRRTGLDDRSGAEQFEAEVSAALEGLEGVAEVSSRVVAVTRSPASLR